MGNDTANSIDAATAAMSTLARTVATMMRGRIDDGPCITPCEVALTLMRAALTLLDAMGENTAACRLQHAIDALLGLRPAQPGDEIDPALIDLFLRPLPSD